MASVEKAMVFLLIFAATLALSFAETYKVGKSDGWTIGNVSYDSWASSQTFHVGDIMVFEYNKQFHNVLQVTKANYKSCNATSPIATHTTGNDSIPIKRKGHYFFICGFTGHCGLGQKVNIRVVDNTPAASPAPLMSPSLSPPSTSTQSSSSPSSSSTQSSSAAAVPPPLGSNNSQATSNGLSFLGCAIVGVASVLVL